MTSKFKNQLARRVLKFGGTTGVVGALTWGFYLALLQVVNPPAAPEVHLAKAAAAAAAVATPLVPETEVTQTVLLRAEAFVSEEGAQATLDVQASSCTPSTTAKLLRVFKSTAQEPTLELAFGQEVCLSIAGLREVEGVSELAGVWASPSVTEMPQLESKVKQWRYLPAKGAYRYITLVSLGYCATEEGDCSATISLVDTDFQNGFFARLPLAGVGVAPLYWREGPEQSSLLE
jgi:hypothetical protein